MRVRNIFFLLIIFTITFPGSLLAQGNQGDPYDFAPDFPDSVLQQRLNNIDSDIPLVFNSYVRSAIDYFTIRKRSFPRKILSRKNVYFPLFEKYLAKHNMPDELKYLSVIESGLNPQIRSRAGAIGLWQFMPATGKMFDLDYDYYIDERMDPEKATEAACIYLKRLYDMFGDWHMALASYNCGPGNIRRAIRRSGYKDTYWEIYNYLPRETRFYVPKFIGMIYTMNYADEHFIFPEKENYPMKMDTVLISQYCNLEVMSQELNICLDDLKNLNPEIKREVIPEHYKSYTLKIPSDKKEYFLMNKVAILDSARQKGKEESSVLADYSDGSSTAGKHKISYRVKRGDNLGRIADTYNVSVRSLKEWNSLYSDVIRIDQRLAIYKDPSYFKKTEYASSKNSSSSEIPGSKTYTVQPGDTLWHISKRYNGLTVEKIKELNNLDSDKLVVGQKLKLG